MTRTGPANVVMPARRSTVTGRPVLAWLGSGESGSGWAGRREPAFDRLAFPGSASGKPTHHRLAGRSGRLRSGRPPQRPPCARAAHPPHPRYLRRPALTHPLYLYLLGWRAASVYGWSFDPGRDILCILTSPPRWLQWP
jgi:hypothetical protein